MNNIICPPEQFAWQRSCSISGDFLTDLPHLRAAWNYSADRLAAMVDCLSDCQLPACVRCVAVGGSLARMEASSASDCDLIIIVDDQGDGDFESGRQAFNKIWAALESLELGLPEPAGIFSGPVSIQSLLNPQTIGHVSEEQSVFGTRMQFLLEAQPIAGESSFRSISRDIVERYATRYIALDNTKQWTYLLNELVRYFKSLCQTYLFEELYDDRRWRQRNLKARHSRVLMYAGLLFLLGESSTVTQSKTDWLAARLTWTPLERLAAVYEAHSEARFRVLAECMDLFLKCFSDQEWRHGLANTIDSDSPLARESNSHFQFLKQNGDRFLAELLHFALDRRTDWSDRFFEYWLF